MSLPVEFQSISGAKELYDWFGYWPKFHDAVILNFHLEICGTSDLKIHTWEISKEADANGYFARGKHVVVELTLQKIQEVSLQDFFGPGIILDLEIQKIEGGYKFEISSSYGINGLIKVGDFSVRLTPGEPASKA